MPAGRNARGPEVRIRHGLPVSPACPDVVSGLAEGDAGITPAAAVTRLVPAPARAARAVIDGAPARPAAPSAVCGKAEIFAAIRPGARICRSQRVFLRAGLGLIEAEPWYSNRKAHYSAILGRLALCMDWDDGTARPGHELLRGPHRPGCEDVDCGCPGRVSPDTVSRAIGWFRSVYLLGLVSPGVTAGFRPGVLHGGEGNLAAIYVCTVPRERSRPLPCPDAGQREFADLSGFCFSVRSRSLRAREKTKVKCGNARPAGGLPLLPRPGTASLRTCPRNRSEALAAARAIQDHCGELAQLSDRHVRHLARPWFAAGRLPQDFLDALDHPPGGPQHAYTQPVRDPAGWARSRLARWLRPDGTLPPTPAQAAAAADRARQAEQAARHREQEALRQQAADALAGGLGDAARAAMRAASPATARALDRAALTKAARRPRPAGTTAGAAGAAADPVPLSLADLARQCARIRDPAKREALVAAYENARTVVPDASPGNPGGPRRALAGEHGQPGVTAPPGGAQAI